MCYFSTVRPRMSAGDQTEEKRPLLGHNENSDKGRPKQVSVETESVNEKATVTLEIHCVYQPKVSQM